MTAFFIFRKLYRVRIYSVLSASVFLGLVYVLLLPQPFEPAILDAPLRLVAATLLVFGAFGLVLELLLTMSQALKGGSKKAVVDDRLFFLPVYEPLDRTRRPKKLADQICDNRPDEVRLIKDFASGGGRVLQITGEPGIGKSSLGALIARRTDFWVNLAGRRIGSVVLVRLLADWFGEDEFVAKAAADEISSADIKHLCKRLAQKPVRLFFNGFDSFLDADGRIMDSGVAGVFKALLSEDGKQKLVFMSRRPLHAELIQDVNAAYLPLEELIEPLAKALLQADEAFDDSLDAEDVAYHVGGNPLLLTLLPPMLPRLDAQEAENVRSWFLNTDASALSERFLKAAAQEDFPLLRSLSLVSEPMTQSFIAALAEAAGSSAEAVERLRERRLIEWDAGLKKFSLHPAVATGAYQSLEADASALSKARLLLAEVCIAKSEDFKAEDKWTSISDCRLLLRAADLLKTCGRVSQAAEIGQQLRPHLQEWGEGRLLNDLLSEAGDPLAGSLDDKASRAAVSKALRQKAAALQDAGKNDAAIDVYHALYILAGKYGRMQDKLYASGRLAELYASVGNVKQADMYGRKQFSMARQTGNPSLIAAAAGRMGHVFSAAGDHGTALRYYAAAAKQFRDEESLAGEARAQGYLAKANFALGHRENAVDAVNRRVDLLMMLGKSEEALAAQMELAVLYNRAGDVDSANAIYKDVVFRAKKDRNYAVAIKVLQDLAQAAFNNGDYPRTLLLQQDRLELSEKVGDKKSIGTALGMIAHCYVRSKNIPEALNNYEEARKNFAAVGYRRGVARCGHFSARLLASEDSWKEALTAVLDSLDFALDNESSTLAMDLRVLGLCREGLGEAAVRKAGEKQLGAERFAAVLGLMR